MSKRPGGCHRATPVWKLPTPHTSHFKSDIFNRLVTYSTDKNIAANLVTLTVERVFEIIKLNKAGEKPLTLVEENSDKPKQRSEFGDILGEDDLTRFDKKKKKRRKSGQKSGVKNGSTPKENGADPTIEASTEQKPEQNKQPAQGDRQPQGERKQKRKVRKRNNDRNANTVNEGPKE